jgi:type IV secretion system protein TrbG
MNHKGSSSLALFLLVAGIAGASQNSEGAASTPRATVTGAQSYPDAAQPQTAVAAGQPTSAGITANTDPDPPTDPTTQQPAAPFSPPWDGVAPDPAVSSAGLQSAPVQLPAATAPAGSCDAADCPAPRDKKALAAAKNNPPVRIGPPAQRALAESHAWAEDPNAMPTPGFGGRVIFNYSESAPTIVCAPLHVCDIELQEGEAVQGAPHVGDSVRWKISPALSGSDEKRVTHLIVKPTESGLDTNLIIATDRHTYHIRLVSSTTRYVASVGFSYPEEQQQEWADLSRAVHGGGSGNGSAEMPTVAVNSLNFDYRIKVVKGKPSFKPLRAMDDGYHTYIAMNEDLVQQEAPVLIGISPRGEEQMINYRVKGNLYIIDGTVHKLAFISGVGRDQQRIELTREPCKRRGWLGMCWDAKE